jgi:tRNA pseudouridine38-40 synthase
VPENSCNTRNIKLVLEFDGSGFHGWQTQKNIRTVQDEVTQAVKNSLREEIGITGCSRTDAGVHAAGYCANIVTHTIHPAETLRNMINSYLPEDISVISACDVDREFHARHSAVMKTYRYSVSALPDYHPLDRKYIWYTGNPPDIDIMREASACLEGEHDFTAFCGGLEPGKSPVRTVREISIAESGGRITLDVRGKSFLYRMVRIITGTLVDAGKGNISVHDVRRILDAADKSNMRAAAPAHGLCLLKVDY